MCDNKDKAKWESRIGKIIEQRTRVKELLHTITPKNLKPEVFSSTHTYTSISKN